MTHTSLIRLSVWCCIVGLMGVVVSPGWADDRHNPVTLAPHTGPPPLPPQHNPVQQPWQPPGGVGSGQPHIPTAPTIPHPVGSLQIPLYPAPSMSLPANNLLGSIRSIESNPTGSLLIVVEEATAGEFVKIAAVSGETVVTNSQGEVDTNVLRTGDFVSVWYLGFGSKDDEAPPVADLISISFGQEGQEAMGSSDVEPPDESELKVPAVGETTRQQMIDEFLDAEGAGQ